MTIIKNAFIALLTLLPFSADLLAQARDIRREI